MVSIGGKYFQVALCEKKNPSNKNNTNMNQFHKRNHTLCPFPDDSFKSSWDETAKTFPKPSVSTPIRSVMGSVLKGINFLGKKNKFTFLFSYSILHLHSIL